MATITASKDGAITRYETEAFGDVRNGAGETIQQTNSALNNAVRVFYTAGRGSPTYLITRTFMTFDTTAVTGTVSSLTLKIHGYGQNSADLRVVKSTAFGNGNNDDLITSDFTAINGLSGINSLGKPANVANVYTDSDITSWSTTAYNTISLNSYAASDIQNNNHFTIAIVEANHDFTGIAQTTSGENLRSGMNYVEANPSKRPYIEFTETATGYSHTVAGVASGDISKVTGVATADISKVAGVE